MCAVGLFPDDPKEYPRTNLFWCYATVTFFFSSPFPSLVTTTNKKKETGREGRNNKNKNKKKKTCSFSLKSVSEE
jgi:hypothetical protein